MNFVKAAKIFWCNFVKRGRLQMAKQSCDFLPTIYINQESGGFFAAPLHVSSAGLSPAVTRLAF